MKEIAILGPTASGKTDLSIEIAQKVGANILSLDSLSIYKEVDIVSAKPTIHERGDIKHFGIDEIYIDDYFSAATFFDIYKKAKSQSKKEGKHLIIVGGSSFYLKSLIEGLSPKVELNVDQKELLRSKLTDLKSAYRFIQKQDPQYAKNIKSSDTYRISKWYEIYIASGMSASQYFLKNKRKAPIKEIEIFEIAIDRDMLRRKIVLRTQKMIEQGLIDEVFYLESRYSRSPKPMKAIGVVETLSYLDGKISLDKLKELITIHTAQLAKRQETFNKSQFVNREKLLIQDLKNKLISIF